MSFWAVPDVIGVAHCPLPFLRLTVLGPAGSGKTSLINSWVNNFCPSVHSSTEKPELYYRTVRLHCSDSNVLSHVAGYENKAAGLFSDAEDQLITALVEIEDTPPPRREQDKGGRPQWDLKSISQYMKTEREEDKAPVPGVAPFAKLRASGLYHVDEEEEDGNLMWGSQKFKETGKVRERSDSLTWVRMGFLVVFDASDPDSFLCAQQIYKKLGCQKKDCHQVWLVANKIDKDPLDPGRNKVFKDAKEYVNGLSTNCSCPAKQHAGMKFMDGGVSAVEFTRVRKLFRDVFEGLITQQMDNGELLWTQDSKSADDDQHAAANAGGGVMGVWTSLFGK